MNPAGFVSVMRCLGEIVLRGIKILFVIGTKIGETRGNIIAETRERDECAAS